MKSLHNLNHAMLLLSTCIFFIRLEYVKSSGQMERKVVSKVTKRSKTSFLSIAHVEEIQSHGFSISCDNRQQTNLLLHSLRGGGREGVEISSGKQLIVAERSRSNLSSTVFDRVEDIKSTTRKMKRTEFRMLLAVRFAFMLILPISTILLVPCVILCLVFTSLRILCFNFLFRDISKIMMALSRATLNLVLASLTGILSPIFAIFGLIAGLSVAAVEMSEPLLRIKYKRELRKLKHLHKLITDPVLLETLGVVMKGAKAISETAVDISSPVIDSAKRTVDRETRNIWKSKKVSVRKEVGASHELVETLLQSEGLVNVKESLVHKLPEPVSNWGQEQFEALRKSGVLESAVSKVFSALKEDLSGAAEFLPYLEAIEKVRKEQEMQKSLKR
mmetsp:Transcript_1641/g.2335  ORF Transcript_1641/g.2335 Transcript_1641/m.2335 type:complete len:389 (+) Transcript_1641:176-1342(+)